MIIIEIIRWVPSDAVSESSFFCGYFIKYPYDKTCNGIKCIAPSGDAQKIATQFSDSRTIDDNRVSLPAR